MHLKMASHILSDFTRHAAGLDGTREMGQATREEVEHHSSFENPRKVVATSLGNAMCMALWTEKPYMTMLHRCHQWSAG
jgi:hypothetical protein